MVRAGLGCTVLPQLALRRDTSRAAFVTRSLSPKLHRRLAMVMRKDKPRHRGLQEMIRALEALCRSGTAST